MSAFAELEGELAVVVDAHRPPARVQLHTFGDGVLDLVRARRHLAALLERDQVDVLRALSQRGERDVDGDVAAADDDDPRSDSHGLAAVNGSEEADPSEHEGLLDTFDLDAARLLGAEAEEDGVVVLAECIEVVDACVGSDRDAEYPNLVELLVEQIRG